MPAPRLPRAQVDILASVFALGSEIGCHGDIGAVLKPLAAMAPDSPRIVAAEARMLVQENDLPGARALLEAAEARHPSSAVLKAMLAFCLFLQRDGLWETYAEEAMALPEDPVARGIVTAVATGANKSLGLEPVDPVEPADSHSVESRALGMLC